MSPATLVPDNKPKPEAPPQIVGVAVRDPEGHVYSMRRPATRANLFQAVYEMTSDWPDDDGWEQGFMTSKGVFVNRLEGVWLACSNGQLDPQQLPQGKASLYTEDLW